MREVKCSQTRYAGRFNDSTFHVSRFRFHASHITPQSSPKNAKATPLSVAPSNPSVALGVLRDAFFAPIAEFEILLHLAAFMTMFLGFSGTVGDFAEGTFRIANHFSDEVQRLDHIAFLSLRSFKRPSCQRHLPPTSNQLLPPALVVWSYLSE